MLALGIMKSGSVIIDMSLACLQDDNVKKAIYITYELVEDVCDFLRIAKWCDWLFLYVCFECQVCFNYAQSPVTEMVHARHYFSAAR